MDRFSVVESRCWRNARTGAAASIYGAVPWTSDAERADWTLESRGWTVADARTGTVGCGRSPWADRADAQAAADRLNGGAR